MFWFLTAVVDVRLEIIEVPFIFVGVPAKPEKAEYSNEENGVVVKWSVDSSNANPVLGYVIEGLDDGELMKSNRIINE